MVDPSKIVQGRTDVVYVETETVTKTPVESSTRIETYRRNVNIAMHFIVHLSGMETSRLSQ